MNRIIAYSGVLLVVLVAFELNGIAHSQESRTVALNIETKKGFIELNNVGDTDINVSFESNKITGFFILPTGKKAGLEKGLYNISASQK